MRILIFSARNVKETIRDPLNLIFGLGFPTVLLLFLSAIQHNAPVDIFIIEKLAPGMMVFGLSFLTLFSATLITKDRESALLPRLYAGRMRAKDFILGYTLPLLPMALAQGALCLLVGLLLGLPFTPRLLLSWLAILPVAVFFIGMGLLCGSLLSLKQVGGICGALLTNLTAFLSGIWFDLALVGGVFERIAYWLPFANATRLVVGAYNGGTEGMLFSLLFVLGYALLSLVLAVFAFLLRMKRC